MKKKYVEQDQIRSAQVESSYSSKKTEALIVIMEFLKYQKGQLIIGADNIKNILSGPFSSCVNKIFIG